MRLPWHCACDPYVARFRDPRGGEGEVHVHGVGCALPLYARRAVVFTLTRPTPRQGRTSISTQ
jgi:hypothetical protein